MSAYEADIKNSELKRVLGKWSLTAIGIGAIIGGGIFVLTGTGAHYHATGFGIIIRISRYRLYFCSSLLC
jgi:amino acid transporter